MVVCVRNREFPLLNLQNASQGIDLLCASRSRSVGPCRDGLVTAEPALVPVAEAVAVKGVAAPEGDHDPVRRP